MRGRKITKLFAVVLTFCVFMTQGGMTAFATQREVVNANGIPEGVVLNYHETAPIDSSFANETSTPTLYGLLPASYSASAHAPMQALVRENHDAGVRNQSPYGTCWAHAAMSIAESSYIINQKVEPDSVDYNEYHLVHYAYDEAADSLNLFGGDWQFGGTGTQILQQGGNNLISLCMFASWHGASNASQEVYGADHIQNGQTPEEIVGYSDAAHMRNGYVLTMPDMSSENYMADMNIVKQMIMEYGSVAISYYAQHSPDYFLGAYQYCYDEHETNHAVTVVGWDDTVSASRFKTAPPGDGAWIVKNSWGDNWGADGYFYLSYYDATIGVNAFAFDFVSGDNYDNNYQYDGTGNFYGYGIGSYGKVVGANAFVADSDETLAAVGFFTSSINTDYEIRIYRDLDEGANPNTGTLVWTQEGSLTYEGYHTVELDTNISIREGERYAVVITLLDDENKYLKFPADVTDSWGWVEFASLAKAGESYVGTDISNLKDLNINNTDNYYRGKNVRIKAFTNERQENEDVKVNSITLSHTTYELEKGNTVDLDVEIKPSSATNARVRWTSSDENIATVDAYGKVTGIERGTAIITATAQDGSGVSASCTVSVKSVLAEKLKITVGNVGVEYYRIDQVGNSCSFGTSVLPYDTTNKKVTWSSSNPAVATIGENGNVSTHSSGLTIITATAQDGSGVSASCLVAVATLLIDTVTITLGGKPTDFIETTEIGKVYDLDAVLVPKEAEMFGVTWESSNPNVASVDQNGKVKIKAKGDVVITASVYAGYTIWGNCYIEVKEKTYPVEGLDIRQNGKSISNYTTSKIGEILYLEAVASPKNATNKTVQWSSSNTSVAYPYGDGSVYIQGYGKTVITAMAQDGSGVKDTITITVEPEKKYHIIFNANGGKGTMSAKKDVKYTTSVTLTNQFTRKGYKFIGWAKTKDGDVVYKDGQKVKGLTSKNGATVTLYAKWKKEEYKITYTLNGGKLPSGVKTKYTITTTTFNLPKPSRTGYTFAGWYTDKDCKKTKVTKIAKGTTGKKTYYAKWTVNKYNLKFNANGGTGKMSEKKNIKYSAKVTLANTFKRKGYTFTGWATSKNGKVVYKNKDVVSKLASQNGKTVTLYAKWKKTEYKITYNLNKGKNSSKNPTSYTITDKTITLKNPTRKGYTFKGWYKDAKFKTKVKSIPKGSTGKVTLYAKWVKKK